MAWPKHGPDFNAWNSNFAEFAKILADAKDERWWCVDMQLKYLDIHIDTRDNGFLLFDRDKNQISPDRVVAAIDSWREKFGRATPPRADP